MELKYKKYDEKFEYDEEDNYDHQNLEQDKQHTRYECNCEGKCLNFKNNFDISFEYWRDSHSEELLNGYENFYSTDIELVQ